MVRKISAVVGLVTNNHCTVAEGKQVGDNTQPGRKSKPAKPLFSRTLSQHIYFYDYGKPKRDNRILQAVQMDDAGGMDGPGAIDHIQ